MSSLSNPSPRTRHGTPVSTDEYQGWFDSDGRLVKESIMRQTLFEVGVTPSCRRSLWKFIFGIYPMNSTRRDQKAIDVENRANYHALRQRWRVLDETIRIPDDNILKSPPYMQFSDDETDDSNCSPPPPPPPVQSHSDANTQLNSTTANGTDSDELREIERKLEASCSLSSSTCVSCGGTASGSDSGNCSLIGSLAESMDSTVDDNSTTSSEPQAKYCSSRLNQLHKVADNRSKCSSESGCSASVEQSFVDEEDRTFSARVESSKSQIVDKSSDQCMCNRRKRSCGDVLDDEGQALLQILEFPSQVYATRQPVELEKSYLKAKRIILRDVQRTDRNIHYFSHKRNLRKVHRILMCYAMFHPDMGYCQGMNDILARFLVVTGSEVDSYWMFTKYMEQKREDFLEHTMMKKVALVKKLIKEIDIQLYNFFERSECHDYLFCHRWLLLDFKREFPFVDSIRLFEVLSSHYLELNSDKAMVETDKVIAKEFELDGGEKRAERTMVNFDFTFNLFVCVAILTMHSQDICKAADAASVYGSLNQLSMNMNLNQVLPEAERLFYKYCQLTITRDKESSFEVLEP